MLKFERFSKFAEKQVDNHTLNQIQGGANGGDNTPASTYCPDDQTFDDDSTCDACSGGRLMTGAAASE